MSNVLTFELERKAAWRADKAKKHPQDVRNSQACTLLNTLAQSGADAELSSRYDELSNEVEPSRWSEIQSDVLTEIGFHFMPKSVDEVLSRIIERQERGLPGMHELQGLMAKRFGS